MNSRINGIIRNIVISHISAAALMIGGCAGLATHPNGQVSESPNSENVQLRTLITYAISLRSRNNAELNAEQDSLTRQYAQQHSEEARLRMAWFHAYSPTGDRGRALALLDVVPGETNGRGRSHLAAAMLIPLLQDQRRADEAANGQLAKLREEQKRSEALQQKLDAIRDIEKKMLERSPGKTP